MNCCCLSLNLMMKMNCCLMMSYLSFHLMKMMNLNLKKKQNCLNCCCLSLSLKMRMSYLNSMSYLNLMSLSLNLGYCCLSYLSLMNFQSLNLMSLSYLSLELLLELDELLELRLLLLELKNLTNCCCLMMTAA
jgi:hypothetical protein